MELSAANKFRIGQVVNLDGVKYAIKDKPFGSASYYNSQITREEVTLTLTREKQVVNGVEHTLPY